MIFEHRLLFDLIIKLSFGCLVEFLGSANPEIHKNCRMWRNIVRHARCHVDSDKVARCDLCQLLEKPYVTL